MTQIPDMEPIEMKKNGTTLEAYLTGRERLSPRKLRHDARQGQPARVILKLSGYKIAKYGRRDPIVRHVVLEPDELRALAQQMLDMADVAEARDRLAADLLAQPEEPAPQGKVAKWAMSKNQRKLLGLMGKITAWMNGTFRSTIAASFDHERGGKAWTPKYNAWYRDIKDRYRILQDFLSAIDDDFLDVDALLKYARELHRYLDSQTWRAQWLTDAGLYEDVREDWAKALHLLDTMAREVESELRATKAAGRRTPPVSAVPQPMLGEGVPA